MGSSCKMHFIQMCRFRKCKVPSSKRVVGFCGGLAVCKQQL